MRAFILGSLVLAALAGCDDETDATSADSGGDPVADAGVGADMAQQAGNDIVADGPWRMAVRFVDVGGLVLEFQLDLEVTGDTFDRVGIKVIDQDGSVSDTLATLTDIETTDGAVEFDFGTLVLPGEFSPTGTDITATLRFAGVIEGGLICGTVRGVIDSLMIDVEMSTFGAVAWQEETAPASCDEQGPETRPTIGGDVRPAQVFLPEDHDPEVALPLVILLHGFSTTGDLQNGYLGLGALVDEKQFVLVLPEGTVDTDGNQFWNATDACCDRYNANPDDVGYLSGLIDEGISTYGLDADRVYLIGHSNGGFMSYRMACEVGTKLAGIGTLAGSSVPFADCEAPAPLTVVHAHGTDDQTIRYAGLGDAQPGAEAVVDFWVDRNNCAADSADLGTANFVPGIETEETERLGWGGCDGDTAVELWRMNDAPHVPGLGDAFMSTLLDTLFAHARAE